jgi:cell division inhibitor SepF
MSSMWRKAMVQLGLGDDDEYDDYDDQATRRAPAPAPEEPRPAAQPRTAPARSAQPRSVQPVPNRTASVSPLPATPEQGGSMRFPTHGAPPDQPTVQPVPRDERIRTSPTPPTVSGVRPIPRPSAKPHVVAPRSFGDAQEVGDTFKAKQPVIINLQGVDRDLSRRLVDFTSGLCYGIGGQMEKVATDVFLLTPVDVEVSPEERQRLQERGLYDS